MKRDAPEPWATAMREAGFVYAHRPSLRQLAAAAGIPSVQTVISMVHGESDPGAETRNAVAAALKVDPRMVASWVGQARTASRDFKVPGEVDLLTTDEQDAIVQLIRAIAKTRREERPKDAATAADQRFDPNAKAANNRTRVPRSSRDDKRR